MEHVWIVNKEYMVATVTCRAPLTVKTTIVICKMDHALPVCQDGPECIVKQNVERDGMVLTVATSVRNNAETAVSVIT